MKYPIMGRDFFQEQILKGDSFMDTGKIFENLVHMAVQNGIIVRFAPLRASYARIEGERIALNQNLETIEDFNYNLAHELAHHFLHYDKGDIITSDRNAEYEEQADRGARMLLTALSVSQRGCCEWLNSKI